MHTWALIAIMAMGSPPQLVGTFKTEAECRDKAEVIEAQAYLVQHFKSTTACFVMVDRNYPQR
jgi:hypothetical protein